jgi:hypothetical protein
MHEGEVEYEFDEGATNSSPTGSNAYDRATVIDMIVGEILDALRWLERRHGPTAVAEVLRRVLITTGAPQS